jgi:two-component system alkaline phosphatase synthesis response regulator PhoP
MGAKAKKKVARKAQTKSTVARKRSAARTPAATSVAPGPAEVVKILVVDDNPDLLYSIKQGLTFGGAQYEVITAEGGKKALETLKTFRPHIILLDIMMPDMDGWDTCAQIKSQKQTKDIPIIFLTAKTDPVSRSMGGLASADYITKPFEIPDLKNRIAAVLKKRS